jgi:hypothetical protein
LRGPPGLFVFQGRTHSLFGFQFLLFRRDIPGKIAVAGGDALGAHFFQLPGVGGFFLPRLCDLPIDVSKPGIIKARFAGTCLDLV